MPRRACQRSTFVIGAMQSKYTTPVPGRSVLLTIDVQRDFTDPGAAAEIPGTNHRVPVMRRILQAYRQHHLPIVHVVRLYLPDGTNADLCRREAIEDGKAVVVPGTQGAELVEPLRPAADVRLDAANVELGEPGADLGAEGRQI